ncbi:MAG: hypothetical protein K9H64_15710 [Bacteroidales bacterium]|nr:hypothetical protein [Bacteroidales bacterium]MCF8458951.1 hypothetical protein [Bacteroidales bacterium]
MNRIKIYSSIIYVFLLLFLIGTGCSNRETIPVWTNDSTFVYPAIDSNDIEARITFFRKPDFRSGDLLGVGQNFSIMVDGDVRANVDLKNRFAQGNTELMFHLDWIGPDRKSFYQKRVDLLPNDTASTLNSSITTSPEIREPGEYSLRVYYFRELIAEKKFELLPEFQLENENGEALSATITLYRTTSKTTGELIGVDSVFTLKKGRNLRSLVDLKNRFVYGKRELLFRTEWTDSTGNAFYSKDFDLSPIDSVSSLYSSISISPENRQAGKYSFQVFLFHELIAEQIFELKEEPKIIVPSFDQIKATITLYSKLDKKTGKLIGEGELFSIDEKARVHAQIDVANRSKYKNQKLSFTLKWIDPADKSFYEKDINLSAYDMDNSLSSSISIQPGKREPGQYCLQLYLFDKMIAEKKFELR